MNKSGDYLRQIRESRSLPKKHLSELTGVSAPYLSDIELGNRMMSHRVYAAVMDAFGTSADERKIMLGYIADDLYQRWLSRR